MQAPTLTLDPPQTETDAGQITIGVAVLSPVMPELFNHLAHTMLVSGIHSALLRGEIHHEHVAYFIPAFSVHLVTVNSRNQAQNAIEEIKQSLADLGLLNFATIATFTPDLVWVAIHGLGTGETQFAEAFLKPENLAAWAENATQMEIRQRAWLETFRNLVNQKANPDPQ